jgi:hypothetical protein
MAKPGPVIPTEIKFRINKSLSAITAGKWIDHKQTQYYKHKIENKKL